MNIEDVKYSVQLPPDGIWSEWRSINEPIKEELILSFKYNKVVTWPESNEICRRIFK